MIKRIAKIAAYAILVAVLVFTGFLSYLTITDYRPKGIVPLEIKNNPVKTLAAGSPFSVATFNIGYCGLDKNQDFFLDGGTMSRSSSKAQTKKNLESITSYLAAQNADVILLQELDINSTRSYYVNELEYMETTFRDYGIVFGQNYKVPWVPVPFSQPMGKADSGLVTFSRYGTSASARYQYPGGEAWPVQLFELDRCFVENRIPVSNGKELVLINSHLSAFDKGGEIRKKQLDFLKSHITEEYSRGNYVIVGGDWNHQLPGTDPGLFRMTESWPFWLQRLPDGFTPTDFQWAVDKTVPTVRTVAAAYVKGRNYVSVIDGFLVSPNVKIAGVKGHDLGFENTDHNPVSAVFILK